MQLELKRIQHEVGITFVHVTHDQEEAMTMADRIVIMNGGRIEQLGTPTELYERPRTAFVAGFLGVSNLLEGTVAGDGSVKLTDGTLVQVPRDLLGGRTGTVRIGVRPEKLRIGGGEANSLAGAVTAGACSIWALKPWCQPRTISGKSTIIIITAMIETGMMMQ